MAIYYIDPHRSTTAATAGTWADPWTLAQSTKSGLAAGDELRIKGVALSSLLTATTYTASYTNNAQITITAGGGLGADFAVGDIVYFPAYDTFAKVFTKSTNLIYLGSTNFMMPWPNTSTGQTSITVRKVDKTTYPASLAANSDFYFGTTSTLDNITISDCWTSSTTRVTDGTVKTLIHCSSSDFTTRYILLGNSSNTAIGASGLTVNCQNTHVLMSNGSSSTANLLVRDNSSTITFKQIVSGFSGNLGAINIGVSLGRVQNTTVNITDFCGHSLFYLILYGAKNCTFNLTNCYISNTTPAFAGFNGSPNHNYHASFEDCSFSISKIYSVNSDGYVLPVFLNAKNVNLTISDSIEYYSNVTIPSFAAIYGNITVTLGSGFTCYKNQRATTVTSVTNVNNIDFSVLGSGNKCYPNGDDLFIPTISLPTGWSYTGTKVVFGYLLPVDSSSVQGSSYKKASVLEISVPDTNVQLPYTSFVDWSNQLITYRDGSSPVEMLGVNGRLTNSGGIDSFAPKVTTDASVYKTTGPSLKTNLASRSTTAWNAYNPTAIKNIKIPVTSGVSYTVTGYIRCNDSAYTNGDCKVRLVSNGASIANQSMTTSCINAWEQFTMTFTASQTGEVTFVWEMYFANGAKSYWLDDLNIA